MKVQKLIELLQDLVNKNPDIEIGILIPEDDFTRIKEMGEKEGTVLYDASINEEEEEDYIRSGLVPIFLGKALSDIPVSEDMIEKPSRVQITLGYPRESGQSPSWKRMHIIPLGDKVRPFFPGYKIPFVIESDIGPIHTQIASAQRGIKGGNVGRYISRGLSNWFRKHSELKPGDIIVFDRLEENRYKMSIMHEIERKLDLERQYILKEYIDNSMSQAIYKKIGDNQFSCQIPFIEDIIVYGHSKEECKNNLLSNFENWILYRLEKGLPLPVVKGIDLSNLIE